MSISQKALEFENRNIGASGKPTLADAYEILKEQWSNGDCDREVGLHLMFLAWYGLIEPEHLTGFFVTEDLRQELNQLLNEVHDYFELQIYKDAEILYVFGLMAHMFWFMLEDNSIWEKRSIEYRQRYRALAPNGIDPEIFRNRGAYGAYYAGQAKIEGGY